jgi:hypothetical protein
LAFADTDVRFGTSPKKASKKPGTAM